MKVEFIQDIVLSFSLDIEMFWTNSSQSFLSENDVTQMVNKQTIY